MRKRIKQLARGKFEYAKPIISFSDESIDFSVAEGKDYSGEFVIRCENHKKLRGVVYSTDARMECLTPQFEGEEVRIRYQFHSKGLEEGECEKGSFVIVCNQWEYNLSFCAQISKEYVESSIGVIKNLYDFTCLAKENWEEAYQLFYHQNFSNIIKANEVKESLIYKGILSAKPSNQNLEEFLIGIQKKDKITCSFDKDSIDLTGIEDTVLERIQIQKSSWGFLDIKITTDCDFIRLTKTNIMPSDFIGSTCSYEFYVDATKLHGGVNYGYIHFSYAYQTFSVRVKASLAKEENPRKNDRIEQKECQVGMMELYQAYRLKRIVTGVWANETIEILNRLQLLDPKNDMYELMKAQVYIINRQRQEAEWILNDFKREWLDHKHPLWGYYLYIMTLMEREPLYVDRMTREIELIFYENPESVMLFWVLSFLQEEYYNNNAHKLKAIEYWVMKGNTSPYLYLEAYYLIWQDPYLLTKLDAFEIRILRWAIKHRAITKDIANQIFQVMEGRQGFDKVLYQLLVAAYEVNPKPEYAGLICSYLIRNQKYDVIYHKWFEMGIELELRITNLYEAYLLSMDERKIIPVPKIIQMYFQYESTLPYKRMAVLYNNIIAAKETEKEMYQKYQRTMGKFAMEQAELEHMDDNLAVLYDDMLDLGLVNEDLAHALSHIVFTHKMVVFDERMVRAIIYQRQMKHPQIVPIVDQAAYFQLFAKDYVVLFEDKNGYRYVGSVSYRLQQLMEPEKYLNKCLGLASDELPYLISHFAQKQSYLSFAEEDIPYFEPLIYSNELSEAYKAEIVPQVIRFYQTREYDGTIVEYLSNLDFSSFSQMARKYLMDLLVECHLFEQAYELIQEYGMDQIGSAAKVALASAMIARMDDEEDDVLIQLCEQAFLAEKYNESVLSYLVSFYQGPTQVMIDLWKAARNYEMNTFELEERILVQSMYTDSSVLDVEDIFRNYNDNGGRELIVLSFLTVCAQSYFVKNVKVSPYMLANIEIRYVHEKELNDACKLALLKYLSELTKISDIQYRIQDELLSEYTRRNMNFAFFKKLDKSLVMKYHLYDKIFVEYRANPQSHVVLHYSRDEDGQQFVTEDMLDLYGGIFVKQFVVFFGEMIQYYISEEIGNQVSVGESNRISNNDIYGEKDQSRYNLLNQMLISNTLQDENDLYHNMKEYAGFDEVTKQVFKIL